MASALTIKWVKQPRDLEKPITQYGEKVLVAIHAIAAHVGLQMQNESRSGAPWQDRTGNARGGLFFAVDGFGLGTVAGPINSGSKALMNDAASVSGDKTRLVIVLSHTVFYGKFLELCNGGRYAIIMSTIEANLPVLEQELQALLAD